MISVQSRTLTSSPLLKRESHSRHCCLFSYSHMWHCHSRTPSYCHEARRATITGQPIRLLWTVAGENGGCRSPDLVSPFCVAWDNGKGQFRTMSRNSFAREPLPVASGRERNGPKSFRKALDLPSPLLGGGSCDVMRPGSASDGGHRATGSMTGMIGNVGGRGGMAGGSSGRAGRWLAGIASGGVSGERSNQHFGKRDLPSHPGTRRLDGLRGRPSSGRSSSKYGRTCSVQLHAQSTSALWSATSSLGPLPPSPSGVFT